MTDWPAFAGLTVALTVLLLGLARVTSTGRPTREDVEWLETLPDGADHLTAAGAAVPSRELPDFSPLALFVNVLISHGLFLVLLVGAAFYTAVPPAAFGISATVEEVALGVGFGLVLAAANTAAGALAESMGYAPSRELRELLAPEGIAGWVLLLGGTLPLVAVFEEALFRGALVGAVAAGFGVSPWLLAGGSSVAFAAAHELQGPAGVAVTGVLGFVLAAGYILTGSLLVVVVAHYLVNATELVVHEGLGVELRGG